MNELNGQSIEELVSVLFALEHDQPEYPPVSCELLWCLPAHRIMMFNSDSP